MLLPVLILIPLALALFSLVLRNQRLLAAVSVPSYLALAAASLRLAFLVCTQGPAVSPGALLRADALSAFFVLLTVFVSLGSLVYSQGYLAHPEEGELPARKRSYYYFFFHLFVSAMLTACLVDNLGHLWVAIEMTTLASTFLVGFYNNKASVEAAWKYLIICSVGITIALLGTVLLYYNAALFAGVKSLDWSVIAAAAAKLDPRLAVVAFMFVFVGYGTKAGLVPMHTWLPDAHSQAMTPVSAMLSGVLLKVSIYALIRFVIIVNRCLGNDFAFNVMLYAGLASVGVAGFFLLVQKDLKRLLAYSSIENVGLIVFGLGIGTPLALFGALFHAFNHACAKSILFFSAGAIVKRYRTHNMHMIQGVIQSMPWTGAAVVIGLFAIAGMPPFAVFISKLTVIAAVMERRLFLLAGLLLVFLAIAFAALLMHLSRIVFGKRPKTVEAGGEAFSLKTVYAGLTAYLLLYGLGACPALRLLLERAVEVIKGS